MEDREILFRAQECFGFDISPWAAVARFAGGNVILREGEPVRRLYFLAEGRVKASVTHENGKTTLTSFLSAPCFLGEMELLGARPADRPLKITAITPCACCALDFALADRMLADPRFLRTLCGYLSAKAVRNTDDYARGRTYPMKCRLARFILLTARDGWYREAHAEAADYLGVSYRHLLYVLSGFVQCGWLERTAAGYRVIDEAALRNAAGIGKELF